MINIDGRDIFNDVYDISRYSKLTSDVFVTRNLNWDVISERDDLTIEFLRKYRDKINWRTISRTWKLELSFLDEFKDKLDWTIITHRLRNSSDRSFISRYKDDIDWYTVSVYADLAVVGYFASRVYWKVVAERLDLTIDFLEKYSNRIDWDIIAESCMNIDILRYFNKNLNWDIVSKRITIHTDSAFIKKISEYLNWHYVSKRISISIIGDLINELDWAVITNRLFSKSASIGTIITYRKYLDPNTDKLPHNMPCVIRDEDNKWRIVWEQVPPGVILPTDIDPNEISDWTVISSRSHLSLGFIEKYENYLDFHIISTNYSLPNNILIHHKDTVNWSSKYIKYIAYANKYAMAAPDNINWKLASEYLSEKVADAHPDKIIWKDFCNAVTLKFVKKYENEITRKGLSSSPNLETAALEYYKYNVSWDTVIRFHKYKFHIKWLEKFFNYINWYEYAELYRRNLSRLKYRPLLHFKDRLDWNELYPILLPDGGPDWDHLLDEYNPNKPTQK